jgi:hypothetical protein
MRSATLIPLVGAMLLAGDAPPDRGARDKVPKTTLEDLVKQRGLPLFTAKALRATGGTLTADDWRWADVDAARDLRKLRGHALVYCDPWDGLSLGAAQVGWKMRQAAPMLGQEGPGTKFLGLGDDRVAVELAAPAQVLLVFVDAEGVVSHTQEVTVTELRLSE